MSGMEIVRTIVASVAITFVLVIATFVVSRLKRLYKVFERVG